MLNRLANESCVSRLNPSIRTKRKEAAKCKKYQRFYQKDGFYKIDLEEKQTTSVQHKLVLTRSSRSRKEAAVAGWILQHAGRVDDPRASGETRGNGVIEQVDP